MRHIISYAFRVWEWVSLHSLSQTTKQREDNDNDFDSKMSSRCDGNSMSYMCRLRHFAYDIYIFTCVHIHKYKLLVLYVEWFLWSQSGITISSHTQTNITWSIIYRLWFVFGLCGLQSWLCESERVWLPSEHWWLVGYLSCYNRYGIALRDRIDCVYRLKDWTVASYL